MEFQFLKEAYKSLVKPNREEGVEVNQGEFGDFCLVNAGVPPKSLCATRKFTLGISLDGFGFAGLLILFYPVFV